MGNKNTKNKQTCPICLEKKQLKPLTNCDHSLCTDCLESFIRSNLKNISKYPMKCYDVTNCNQILHFNDVSNVLKNKSDLKIFEKFSVLCAIPDSERDLCPSCDMIFFMKSRIERSKLFELNTNRNNTHCLNKECNNKFGMSISIKNFTFNIRRHHCRICAGCYCSDCSSFTLPLTAASYTLLKQYVDTGSDKPDNWNTINSKQWWLNWINKLKNETKTSTNQNKSVSDEKYDEKYDDSNDKDWMNTYLKELEQQQYLKDNMNLTDSDKAKIANKNVRCCEECWLAYYKICCMECGYIYCIKCKQEWIFDKHECKQLKHIRGRSRIAISDDDLNDLNVLNELKNENFMISEGYRKCPGCSVWISKIEGCNHMVHQPCQNPNEIDKQSTNFCYCCGDGLYEPFYKFEKDGTLHFPNGRYSECRKYKVKEIEKKSKLKSIKNKLNL
eukprot:31489_1